MFFMIFFVQAGVFCTIKYNFWLFQIATKWKLIELMGSSMKWNASANLCISVLQIKSQASVCRKMPIVVLFQRWTVHSCEFKRVGDWLFPKQSSSWLRHSNPCAPNHTAVLSARGYNQGNTSKMSLWSWSASHAKLTIWALYAHKHIHRITH